MADTSTPAWEDRNQRSAVNDTLLRSRAAIVPCLVLDPSRVPRGPAGPPDLEPDAHVVLLRLHALASRALQRGDSLAAPLQLALAGLPPASSRAGFDERVAPAATAACHDRCFRVQRVPADEGSAGLAYARSILLALRLNQQEASAAAGALEDKHAYADIATALLALLGRYLQLPVDLPAPRVRRPEGGTGAGGASEPLRHWIHGHQIATVLTQGLIWALHAFGAAQARGRPAAAEAALELAALTLEASATAQGFAADAMAENAALRSMAGSDAALPSHDARLALALCDELAGEIAAAQRKAPAAQARFVAARARALAGEGPASISDRCGPPASKRATG